MSRSLYIYFFDNAPFFNHVPFVISRNYQCNLDYCSTVLYLFLILLTFFKNRLTFFPSTVLYSTVLNLKITVCGYAIIFITATEPLTSLLVLLRELNIFIDGIYIFCCLLNVFGSVLPFINHKIYLQITQTQWTQFLNIQIGITTFFPESVNKNKFLGSVQPTWKSWMPSSLNHILSSLNA